MIPLFYSGGGFVFLTHPPHPQECAHGGHQGQDGGDADEQQRPITSGVDATVEDEQLADLGILPDIKRGFAGEFVETPPAQI